MKERMFQIVLTRFTLKQTESFTFGHFYGTREDILVLIASSLQSWLTDGVTIEIEEISASDVKEWMEYIK